MQAVEAASFLEQQGTQYWSQETASILENAVEAAREIAIAYPDRRLPVWVGGVLDNYDGMIKGANAFTERLAADTASIENGQPIEGVKTLTDSVERWYRSLGPTNESPDLADSMLRAVNVLDEQPGTSHRYLLQASLLHDTALRTEQRAGKQQLLRLASKSYKRSE